MMDNSVAAVAYTDTHEICGFAEQLFLMTQYSQEHAQIKQLYLEHAQIKQLYLHHGQS